ncbi:hypothetical protein ON010_g18406 [Phytophthora cinnamomi]|nr:hypothetical protein ON010_g18406 [Phytophthora cinnamomi]
MSDFFRAFNALLGQRQRSTLAYRPQANGTAERMVQTISRSLRMFVEDENQQDWDDWKWENVETGTIGLSGLDDVDTASNDDETGHMDLEISAETAALRARGERNDIQDYDQPGSWKRNVDIGRHDLPDGYWAARGPLALAIQSLRPTGVIALLQRDHTGDLELGPTHLCGRRCTRDPEQPDESRWRGGRTSRINPGDGETAVEITDFAVQSGGSLTSFNDTRKFWSRRCNAADAYVTVTDETLGVTAVGSAVSDAGVSSPVMLHSALRVETTCSVTSREEGADVVLWVKN